MSVYIYIYVFSSFYSKTGNLLSVAAKVVVMLFFSN